MTVNGCVFSVLHGSNKDHPASALLTMFNEIAYVNRCVAFYSVVWITNYLTHMQTDPGIVQSSAPYHPGAVAMTPIYLVPETTFQTSSKILNSVKLVIHVEKGQERYPSKWL